MDIYFSEEYGKLSECIENGISEVFEFESAFGAVRHMFIKRALPFLVDGEQYYDLITPYGYGGPLVVSAREGEREALCDAFGAQFSRYCADRRIISEFVRFHPVLNNAADFREVYQPLYMRQTLGTDLASFDDPVQSEFSKSCRKNIRRALNRGVRFRVTEAPEQIDAFFDIYFATMRRDHATEFYYFDRTYFAEMLQLFREKLLFAEAIYEDRVIAAGIYFLSDKVIHVHLSGTLSEYLYLSPAYLLRYAVTLWGKEHGYRLIHHGGGTGNAEDNPLYLFKKQFAQHTSFPFYVGKKIWNQAIYDKACEAVGKFSRDFFPAYRLGEQ